MADEQHGSAAGLGEANQRGRTLAQLRHGTRRRVQFARVHGLDRVDDQHPGGGAGRSGDDVLDAGFGDQTCHRITEPQASRTQRHLAQGLFAGRIQHRTARLQRRGRLQHQRRLADPRITAEQRHRARHQAATEYTVELPGPARPARLFNQRLGCQCRRFHWLPARGARAGTASRGERHFGNQRVPFTATRTLPLPLRRTGSTVLTNKDFFELRHADP